MNINDVLTFLKEYDGDDITLMEVCGTHTASISENAIPSIISDRIHLISGPGCPVCVTVSDYVDKLCELALDGNTIVTFGDMIRVPGTKKALKDIKSEGADIRMVYSPIETIEMAKNEPDRTFVFAAVGFETTTPIYAVLIDEAIKNNITNIKLLTALKTMPNVIRQLCQMDSDIDGFIAPGHVAVLTGSKVFDDLAKETGLPFVISGFEAEEILSAIYALVKLKGQSKAMNLYKSVVHSDANDKASSLVSKYFEPYDASWRGLGKIDGSGMAIKKEYQQLDAGSRELVNDNAHTNGCSCGDIIIGAKKPNECRLYGRVCNPENPKGACMVSCEGSCFNYYINNRG